MPDNINYKIRTVADFLDVPEADRSVCLREFLLWIQTVCAVRELNTLMPGTLEAHMDESTFNWLNDGKGEARFTIHSTTKIAPETPA